PAVFSPPRSKRKISRRVGSASALKASFMCMAGDTVVKLFARCLNNSDQQKGSQEFPRCDQRNSSGDGVVGQGVHAEGVRGIGMAGSSKVGGLGSKVKPLAFAVVQGRQSDPVQDGGFIV